jgi:hypothetical protein
MLIMMDVRELFSIFPPLLFSELTDAQENLDTSFLIGCIISACRTPNL